MTLTAADLLCTDNALKLRLTLMCAQVTATAPETAAVLQRLGQSLAGELPLEDAMCGNGRDAKIQSDLANGPLCCDFIVQAIGWVLDHGGPVAALEPWLVDILRAEDRACFAGGRFMMQDNRTIRSITLAQAKCIAEAAEERAEQIGVPMVISVVDTAGDMVLHQRMEDALHVSINVSLGKAYSAAAFKTSTDKLAALTQPGAPLYGIQHSNPRVIVFGGGFPICDEGRVIGAVGISGGSVEEDMDVGLYALQAVQ